MSTYSFNIILLDGEIIADSITADSKKDAERFIRGYYDGVASIELLSVN